jgi:Tol biopolymer transport system component
MNQSRDFTDVTYRLPLIISEWQNQIVKINQSALSLYPQAMSDIFSQKSTNVYFSPDKEKVLFAPTENLTLPANLTGQNLPNINSTPETRQLTQGSFYVFDLKEGTNYPAPLSQVTTGPAKLLLTVNDATSSATLPLLKQIKAQSDSRYTTNTTWYGNRQLITTTPGNVQITDYDGVNPVTLTNAQISSNFLVPSPDASKLVLLTNINQKPDIFNLISFDLK